MMKYIEEYGNSLEDAKRFFVNAEDIGCESCNTTCTWEDIYFDKEGNYLCEDCAMETEGQE